MRRLITAALVSTIALAGFSLEQIAKKAPGNVSSQASSVIMQSHEGELIPLKNNSKTVHFATAYSLKPFSAPAKESEIPTEIVDPSLDIIRTGTDWYAKGSDWYTGERFEHPVFVAFDGNTIYMRGLITMEYTPEFEDIWVAGIIEDGVITFPELTYCGNLWDFYDVYFTHLNLTEDQYFQGFGSPEAIYDTENGLITFTNDCCFNMGADEGAYFYGTGIAAGTTISSEVPDPRSCDTGDPVELPYSNDFDTLERFYEFGTIDANEDNNTWTWAGQKAKYSDVEEDADDWLVSPAMYFEAGKTYSISIDATKSHVEHVVSFWLGKEPNIDAMTQMLLKEPVTAQYNWDNIEFQKLVNEKVSVEESGYYHVGIYIEGPVDPMYFTFLDNFLVEELNGFPEKIADLSITANAEGNNTAVIDFTAPTNLREGSTILEGTLLDIYVNGEVATQSKPGEKVSHTVEVTTPGTYTFEVCAAIGDKKSPSSSVTAYIGIDTPSPVTGFEPIAVAEGIDFSWDAVAPTGINGNTVRPEEIRYNVWSVKDTSDGLGYYQLDKYLSEDLTDTNWHYATDDINTVEQGEYPYGITAKNSFGESEGVMGYVYYGKPYELPFKESFANHTISSTIMFSYVGAEPYFYFSDTNSDDDGCGLQAMLTGPCEFALKLGKINLEEANSPYFIADFMSDKGATGKIIATTPSNEEVELASFNLSKDSFKRECVSLDKVASQPWIRITMDIRAEEGGNIFMDNFNVLNLENDNIATDIDVVHTMTSGASYPITVNVSNIGKNIASDYDVVLYVAGKRVAQWEGESLDMLNKATFTYEYRPSVFDKPGDVVVKATADYAQDDDAADNISEVTVRVNDSVKRPITDLKGEVSDNRVSLSWGMPEVTVNSVVEDFEQYDVQIVEDGMLGEWTGLDCDKGFTSGFASYKVNWPWNDGQPYAFGLVDLTNMNLTVPFPANSGDKAIMFMSVFRQDLEDPSQFYDLQADKWLISPELSGEAISLSFFARPLSDYYGYETLEIMVSDTDMDPASFKRIDALYLIETEWDEYYFDLPAGTKYFALHYATEGGFALFIDDIAYGDDNSKLSGFNVYVDNVKVDSVDSNATEYDYTLPLSDGEHLFSVTADYGGNESMPQSIYLSTTPTGVDTIFGNGKEFDIYSVDGVCVKRKATSVEGVLPGVYVIGNRKVIVK